MEAWGLQISIIGYLCVLSWLSTLVTNADKTCNGSFHFENTTVHRNKLTADANTQINITFLLKYDRCSNSRDFDIEISKLDKRGAGYLPQCKIIRKNGTCRNSQYITDLTCECLNTTDSYIFAKTVTESDRTDWKWSTNNKTVTAVISFDITDKECQDTRKDCFLFASSCHEATIFMLSGCKKTCALCKTKITDSENECQNTSAECYLLANNCSSANYSMLSGCKKICVLCNKTTAETPETPFFYLTSNNENDTNITVSENQTVNFVCTPGNTATKSLVLEKENKIENKSQELIYKSFVDLSVNNSYTYTIISVQCNDSGVYRCVVFNLYGSSSSSATLRVECDKHVCKLNEECVTDHRETSTNLLSSNEIFTQSYSHDVNSTPITLAVIGAVFVVTVVVLFVLLNKYRGSSQEAADVEPGPSSGSWNFLWCLKTSKEDTTTDEPQFLGTEADGQTLQDPMTYFRNIIENNIIVEESIR